MQRKARNSAEIRQRVAKFRKIQALRPLYMVKQTISPANIYAEAYQAVKP